MLSEDYDSTILLAEDNPVDPDLTLRALALKKIT
jgi:hypothetical protein